MRNNLRNRVDSAFWNTTTSKSGWLFWFIARLLLFAVCVLLLTCFRRYGYVAVMPYSIAQRPVGANGLIRYNHEAPGFEYYDGAKWSDSIPYYLVEIQDTFDRYEIETYLHIGSSYEKLCPPVSDTSTLKPQPVGMCIIFQDSVYVRFSDRWHNLER